MWLAKAAVGRRIIHFRCDEGWSGDDCSCDESESRCYSPYNEKVCSNHGVS